MNSFLTSLKRFTVGYLVLFSMVSYASVDVSDSHVREVIPGNTVTSAYMEITNSFGKTVKLVGASSDVSDRVEIHEHTMTDGMMKMGQVKSLVIAANESIVLKPYGYHLMIFDVNKPVKAGDKVSITLHFEQQQDVTITVPVQSIKKQARQQHHH